MKLTDYMIYYIRCCWPTVPYAENLENSPTKISDIRKIVLNDAVGGESDTKEVKENRICTHADQAIIKKVYDYAYEPKMISLNYPITYLHNVF